MAGKDGTISHSCFCLSQYLKHNLRVLEPTAEQLAQLSTTLIRFAAVSHSQWRVVGATPGPAWKERDENVTT